MAGRDTLTEERLHEILHYKPRIEKIAIKDVKMRTFITQDDERDDLVAMYTTSPTAPSARMRTTS